MSEKCKQCNNDATWEIEVLHPGPVDTRWGTYYACDNFKDYVGKNRSQQATYKSI